MLQLMDFETGLGKLKAIPKLRVRCLLMDLLMVREKGTEMRMD